MRKRGKLRRWEVEKLGKKQDFRMGSLEGGSRTRRRPKGRTLARQDAEGGIYRLRILDLGLWNAEGVKERS